MPEPTSIESSVITRSHVYRATDTVHAGPMATLRAGRWERFDLPVYIRTYESLLKLQLRHPDVLRVRDSISVKAGKVRAAGLADILDSGQFDNVYPWVVLRLPPGRLLWTRVSRREEMAMEAIVRMTRNIADALESCREAGEPHRGPTLDRIWVDDDGNAVLLGHGEVLYRSETIAMSAAMESELVWHLPPECIVEDIRSVQTNVSSTGVSTHTGRLRAASDRGDDTRTLEDDPRAEVYTLACSVYACINGHHPFFANLGDVAGSRMATINSDPPELRGFPVESEVAQVILRGLHLDPAQRWADPIDFAAALAEAVAPRAPAAEVDGEDAEIVEDTTSGSPLWRASAIALFVALVGLLLARQFEQTTLIVTSNPSGVPLEEIVGHIGDDRGETPVILRDRPLSDLVRLRVMSPDGTHGETHELRPSEFEDLGRCRAVELNVVFD